MIGKEPLEAQRIIGRLPDEMHGGESDKRWMPFHFGNDAWRMQAQYKGEAA